MSPEFDFSYDIIVVTAGAVTRIFPIAGIGEQAIGLKHIEEAISVRDELLAAFDRASDLSAGPERRRLLTVTFVGRDIASLGSAQHPRAAFDGEPDASCDRRPVTVWISPKEHPAAKTKTVKSTSGAPNTR
jgi:hypothetical protein